MATTDSKRKIQNITLGKANIQLTNLRLRDDLLIDELHLEGGDLRLDLPPEKGDKAHFATGETKFRALMTEPNVNLLLAANLPADSPVRNLHIAFLSGKARITGQLVKLITIPFTVEASLKVENGVRPYFDLQSAKLGIGLPSAVVEVIEQVINQRVLEEQLKLDLTRSPVPIYIDELRMEPGRLTALGKARIVLPPVSHTLASAPFASAPLPPPTETAETIEGHFADETPSSPSSV